MKDKDQHPYREGRLSEISPIKRVGNEKGRKDGNGRGISSSERARHLHVIEGGRQGNTGSNRTAPAPYRENPREQAYASRRRRRPWFRVAIMLVTILVIVGMVLSYM